MAPDNQIKSVHVRHEDLEKWVYTQNRVRCYKMRLPQSARGAHHTPHCRAERSWRWQKQAILDGRQRKTA